MSLFSRWSRRRTAPDVPTDALPFPDSSPEGLAARWVRWTASFGPRENPIADAIGEFGARAQPDDVFFLTGTFGTSERRRVTVPAGRDLFFPVINMWHTDLDGPAPGLEDYSAVAELDDVPLAVSEVATPRGFGVAGADDNPVTGSAEPTTVTVWGAWCHVPAPAPGQHRVWFSGRTGGFVVEVDYTLDVE